ncbi:MAG: EI24 domain-containing protein [Deltaproteobacteria bacterium]|nr:MAG: EI24 domain-containing protein [Deltaproteobacteria bacterium]
MNPVTSAAAAARLHLEGLRLLLREASLRRLAWAPILIAFACFALALGLVIAHAGSLYAFAAGWLPTVEAGAWYTWAWVGPARFLLAVVGVALFLALVAVGFVLAFTLASVVASPFLDVLSRRVETLVQGAPPADEAAGLWREAGRAVLEELRRMSFFVAVSAAIAVAGLALPGGQALAPFALALFSILFLPLEYAGYALDRRRVSFRDKRRFVVSHAPEMLGFGGLAFGICLVPGLNVLALPVFVVAGTLLVLRWPPEAKRPPPGSA